MKPIDLRAEFGDKWRIELDESAKGRWADPWNYVVPCRHGHLYSVGGEFLGAATSRSGAIVRKLRAIDGVELVADGEDGGNAVFHRAKLRFIQALVAEAIRSHRILCRKDIWSICRTSWLAPEAQV